MFSDDDREGSFSGVWGTSAIDVYAVGFQTGVGGVILHYDGTAWSTMTTGTTPGVFGGLFDVWGTSSSDIYAVGGDGILHYDGAVWSPVMLGLPVVDSRTNFRSVWGTSPSDVYVVDGSFLNGRIVHFDGPSWSELSLGPEPGAIWGTSTGDAFMVGNSGIFRGSR